ncbi:hypothetical protein B0H16DRAFT_1696867 [Mycena metata]|uniref:Uncharacterized protein n=1 Tax=Mycena metata TaxID=1033252 RepID=A0AAD7HXY7_9AGAR|nr:hypothetical protein B0H16DRAFT_1696867 [Mycena metata]
MSQWVQEKPSESCAQRTAGEPTTTIQLGVVCRINLLRPQPKWLFKMLLYLTLWVQYLGGFYYYADRELTGYKDQRRMMTSLWGQCGALFRQQSCKQEDGERWLGRWWWRGERKGGGVTPSPTAGYIEQVMTPNARSNTSPVARIRALRTSYARLRLEEPHRRCRSIWVIQTRYASGASKVGACYLPNICLSTIEWNFADVNTRTGRDIKNEGLNPTYIKPTASCATVRRWQLTSCRTPHRATLQSTASQAEPTLPQLGTAWESPTGLETA